jgi:hypothetical protein
VCDGSGHSGSARQATRVVIRRQLKRRHVLAFFQKLPPCLVGIEVPRSGKRLIVSCDQQYRGGYAGRMQAHRDHGCQPVVAVDHGDCEQHAHRLEIKARPFDEIHFRPADGDPLPTCIERGLERARDLALRGLLTRTGCWQRENELQGVGERARSGFERGRLAGHHWPFHRRGSSM